MMDTPCFDGVLATNIEEKDADILRLTNLLEESRQEAHELRSRLQIAERCTSDYEAELEALQQDAFEKDNLHAAAIREIQDEKSNALKDLQEKIEHRENEYQLLSEKLAGLQKELDAKSVNDEILNKERNETAALHHELEEALDALTASTAACNQHKELVSILQTDKKELAHRVESLEQNLELYKEYLFVAKAQLVAQTEESKEYQEQLAITQSELSALKAAPDVQARGNSLFAEVEDKRQQMVKQYKLMLAKFNHMKNDYSAKCSEITKLKKEKSFLLDKLEFAEREAKKHYKGFVENYEIRIKELQMAVNDLKNDVKPVYLNGNDEILKFAEQTVVNSRKEIVSLREEMEMRSALRLNEAAELLKTRGELAQARIDLRKNSLMVQELTTVLNERGLTDLLSSVRNPTSSEEESVKPKSAETMSTPKRNSVVLQKSKEIVFKEELLHDMINPRKRTVNQNTVLKDVDPQIKNSEVSNATDGESAKLEESTNKVDVVVENGLNSDWTDGKSNAAILADELGLAKKLDTDLEDVEVEEIFRGQIFVPPVSEEAYFTNSSVRERSVVWREEVLNDVPLVDNPRLSTTLIISPSCSGRFAPAMEETTSEFMSGKSTNDVMPEKSTDGFMSEKSTDGFMSEKSTDGFMSEKSTDGFMSEKSTDDFKPEKTTGDFMSEKTTSDFMSEKSTDDFKPEKTTDDSKPEKSTVDFKSSPRLSDTKSCTTVKAPSPLRVRSGNRTVGRSVMATDLTSEMNESALLNSTKYEEMSRPFENSMQDVLKEVRFDNQEMEKAESDKENSAGIVVKAEVNRDGEKVEEEEEKKPMRRRPRPKQTHPIFYMT